MQNVQYHVVNAQRKLHNEHAAVLIQNGKEISALQANTRLLEQSLKEARNNAVHLEQSLKEARDNEARLEKHMLRQQSKIERTECGSASSSSSCPNERLLRQLIAAIHAVDKFFLAGQDTSEYAIDFHECLLKNLPEAQRRFYRKRLAADFIEMQQHGGQAACSLKEFAMWLYSRRSPFASALHQLVNPDSEKHL